MISACKDSQFSMDAYIPGSGNSRGACTNAFVKALNCDKNPSYIDLLNSMRKLLKSEYSQIIQLSTNKRMDMRAPFITD